MNPEAGLLQSPFRLAVERVAKSHPLMKWQEVHRLAHKEVDRVTVMAKLELCYPYYKYSDQQVDVVATPVAETPGQQELSLS